MSDTVGTRGARGVRGSPGGHLMILDHLELCWTDVKNLQDGPVQTFCSLYGGTWPSLGPQMGGLNWAKTAPDRLQIRSGIRHNFQSDFRPVMGSFQTPTCTSKTHKNPGRGVKKNTFFNTSLSNKFRAVLGRVLGRF